MPTFYLVNNTTAVLGIGTASPSFLLDVRDTTDSGKKNDANLEQC
jgi:hypothetical protein